MGNGVSVDQGNLPSYGSGDVSDAADRKQHDWSQLADAPIIEQPSSALWSLQQSYRNCNKEYSTTIGKASSVFGRLQNMWSNKNMSGYKSQTL